MNRVFSVALAFALVGIFSLMAVAQDVDYVQGRPLSESVQTQAKPVAGGKLIVPVITWGGDVATIYADTSGVLRQQGLDIELVVENNFQKQVENCLNGKTPLLRGTMGMINAAAETFKKRDLDLVIIYQLTWSSGGDCMVVREGTRTPNDLAGKTIALQYMGPHMDYAANIVKSSRLQLGDVKFRWLKELTLPKEAVAKANDPVTAFQKDKNVDAVMCISPDAAMLTGREGVKGAKTLLSTKTASRVIADVYAVRKDWFDKNRKTAENLTHALMLGQEKLQELLKTKGVAYNQLLTKSAVLLLDSPQATADVEGMIADAEFADHAANVGFFTGVGTTRTALTLTDEIQTSLIAMGLMKARTDLEAANWDYGVLAAGLKNIGTSVRPKFDSAKVTAKVTAEAEKFSEDGTLFVKEVFFKPNQNEFREEDYASDFDEALKLLQTYNGAVVVIEGHADPLGIKKAKAAGKPEAEINQMEQAVKNLSLKRARGVLDSFLKHCAAKKVKVDESQLVPVGMGVAQPKHPNPRNEKEWRENMRVGFRIRQFEAELSEFSGTDK